MRIVFLAESIYPFFKGGKEKRLYDLAKALVERGHDVHVYCMKSWEGKKTYELDGINLHAICPRYDYYTKSGKRSIIQTIKFAGYTFPGLIKEKFDVLDIDNMPYFHIFPAWLVCKLKRKKMIVTWHEYWGRYWFEYLGWKGIFGFIIEKISKLFSKNIICVSKLTKQRMNKKCFIIPNGINFNEIKLAKPSKEHFEVLYVGRLIKEKNVEFLIKTIKGKYSLGIIGSGPELERLKKIASHYSNIKVLGPVENAYSYMKSCKVFVSPSKREGFGITIIEAFACGKPVVVMDYEDNAGVELVQKQFVANEKNLLKKIELALKSKIEFDLEKYNWKNIAKQIEGVYRK